MIRTIHSLRLAIYMLIYLQSNEDTEIYACVCDSLSRVINWLTSTNCSPFTLLSKLSCPRVSFFSLPTTSLFPNINLFPLIDLYLFSLVSISYLIISIPLTFLSLTFLCPVYSNLFLILKLGKTLVVLPTSISDHYQRLSWSAIRENLINIV